MHIFRESEKAKVWGICELLKPLFQAVQCVDVLILK